MQTWLKRDSRLQSELLIQPITVTVEQLQAARDDPVPKWWRQSSQAEAKETWRNPTDFKQNSRKATEIDESAKKMHLVTDVKKAVFKAIMSSDDYLHAYEQLMNLNLKKT